jgi:NADH-quinone oxidoreductase subunit L
MKGRESAWKFYFFMLITLAMAHGAALSNNLVMMLFFWEGLLVTLFGMIMNGHKNAFPTAVKAFIINGVTDLCLMVGIGITVYVAGTASMDLIKIPVDGNALSNLGFALMAIGAVAKAGSMPFHSWIPDAAVDAPLPFMAFLPAAVEKLLGIYLLARITLDFYPLTPESPMSIALMVLGAVTILLAVMMALVQKDYKRLLSFHAISQVGYMILGIGTAVPAGIVGGLFHMINHAVYKCTLFLTGGMVEKQTGTTDLAKLGGLGRKMPATMIIFIIAACSISGVPPFNGFFSKELVYDGALHRGLPFYLAAVIGSFLTAASFLKLGHAAYFGKPAGDQSKVKEAPLTMLVPAATLAAICVWFGVWNALPLNTFIQPILGARMEGLNFAGFHMNVVLVGGTLVALALAVLNHMFGVKRAGSGLKAADHIHYAPGFHAMYDKAEARAFDPYVWFVRLAEAIGAVGFKIDRLIDGFYMVVVTWVTEVTTACVRKAHTGSHVMYIAWSLVGLLIVMMSFLAA